MEGTPEPNVSLSLPGQKLIKEIEKHLRRVIELDSSSENSLSSSAQEALNALRNYITDNEQRASFEENKEKQETLICKLKRLCFQPNVYIETERGERFGCLVEILQERSPSLLEAMDEESKIILLKTSDRHSVSVMLEYIATGDIDLCPDTSYSRETISSLAQLAAEHKIEAVLQAVGNFLDRRFNDPSLVGTALSLMNSLREAGLKMNGIKKACIKTLGKNIRETVNHEAFRLLSLSDVVDVLERMDTQIAVAHSASVGMRSSGAATSKEISSEPFDGINLTEHDLLKFRLKVIRKSDGFIGPYLELVSPQRGDPKPWPQLLDVEFLGLGQDVPFAQGHSIVFDGSYGQKEWKFSGEKVLSLEDFQKFSILEEDVTDADTAMKMTVEVQICLPTSMSNVLVLKAWARCQHQQASSCFSLTKYLKEVAEREGITKTDKFMKMVQGPLLDYLAATFENIQEHQDLSLLDEESFGWILSNNHLKVKTEYQALHAVKKWSELTFHQALEWETKRKLLQDQDLRNVQEEQDEEENTVLQGGMDDGQKVIATGFDEAAKLAKEQDKGDEQNIIAEKEGVILGYVIDTDKKKQKDNIGKVGKVKWIREQIKGFFRKSKAHYACIELKDTEEAFDCNHLKFYRDPSKLLPLLRFPFITLHQLKDDKKFWAILETLPVGVSLISEAFSVQIGSGSATERNIKRKMNQHPCAISTHVPTAAGNNSPNQSRKRARMGYSEAAIPAYFDKDIMEII